MAITLYHRECLRCNKKFSGRDPRKKYCSLSCGSLDRKWPSIDKTLWARLSKDSEDGCWHWLGYKMPDGYGRMRYRKKMCLVHRASWIETYGEIPEGMQALHRCDIRDCANPKHLFLGTQTDNIYDMLSKGRAVLNGLSEFNRKRTEENKRKENKIE